MCIAKLLRVLELLYCKSRHALKLSLTCSNRLSTKLQYVASPLGVLLNAVYTKTVHVLDDAGQKTVFSHGHTKGSFLSLELSLVEPREEPEYKTI